MIMLLVLYCLMCDWVSMSVWCLGVSVWNYVYWLNSVVSGGSGFGVGGGLVGVVVVLGWLCMGVGL